MTLRCIFFGCCTRPLTGPYAVVALQRVRHDGSTYTQNRQEVACCRCEYRAWVDAP